MALHLFSAHHADHGLPVVATLTAGLAQLTQRLRDEDSVVAALTVATCNRVEMYLDSSLGEADLRSLLDRALLEVSGRDAGPERIDPAHRQIDPAHRQLAHRQLAHRQDEAAVHHLFRVSAGLDSMVIGDREVAAQVRASLREARARGLRSRDLGVMAEQALRTARVVRRRTHLGARGRSVVSVALDLVPRDWAHTPVTVVGTGAYAGAVVAELVQRGCGHIRVHSESGRAAQFAADRPGVHPAHGSVLDACGEADVVIACRGTGRPVIDLAIAQQLVAGRTEPLTLIDLAVGHDIDPRVAELDRVGLLDLDTVGRHAPETSRRDIARAEQIVADGVAHTMELLRGRVMDPAVVALRDTVASMVAAEVDRLPVGRDLTHAEASQALRRLAARLAHQPSVRARSAAATGRSQEYLAALIEVWGPDVIEPPEAPVDAPPAAAPGAMG